jgi:hypothetical protein
MAYWMAAGQTCLCLQQRVSAVFPRHLGGALSSERATEVPAMHIPDGYLSPVFSLGSGVVTIPTWAVAATRCAMFLIGALCR